MKVLFFYQDFGAMGGIERYLIETTSHLQSRGAVEPVVVCCAGTPLYKTLQAKQITTYGLPSPAFFQKSILRTFDLVALGRLIRIIQKEQPDIIHVHVGVLDSLILKWLGYPVVYTVHGYGTLYSMQNATGLKALWKKMVRFLFRQTAKRMDNLLFVSAAEQARMNQEGFIDSPAQGLVLHNGISTQDWRNHMQMIDPTAIKARLSIPQNAEVISFIGRMDANKNPLQFLELAQRLLQKKAIVHPHFMMAGDGPLLDIVKERAKDIPNIHILGHCENIAEVLAISNLTVHLAQQEGFGLGIVEAMACGVPCVAYASGGATEILDGPYTAQCLVPSGDFDALAGRVKTLLNLPTREKFRLKQALMHRAEAFNSERFIGNLEQVYHNLAPKVSVILPVYQGEGIVLRAVQSVLQQTYPHLELIVVDDGSKDGTLTQLETVQDSRLKVIQQANQGVSVARNFGFEHATGDYIAFIDADDIWLPNKLAVELATIRRYQSQNFMMDGLQSGGCVVYSGYYAVDEEDRLIHLPPLWKESGNLTQTVLAYEGIFLPSTAMVHRTVFEALGGFKQDCYHEDRVFFIEACRRFPAYPTQQRLVIYRQSESGRCRKILQNYDEALAAELSIVDTLRPELTDSEVTELSLRQLRNLMYRFLMYNHLPKAAQVYQQLQAELAQSEAPPNLFAGKKGWLSLLSLKLRVNFLTGSRLLIQGLTRHLFMPWWSWKTRFTRQTPLSPESATQTHPRSMTAYARLQLSPR